MYPIASNSSNTQGDSVMNFTKTLKISLAAFALLGSGAQALSRTELASREQLRVIRQFKSLQLGAVTQKALNILVDRAILALNEQGYDEFAVQSQREWTLQFSNHFALSAAEVGSRGLGDHVPLLDWLSRFYQSIERRINKHIITLLRLDDIMIFNHGIPVVFDPNGDQENSDVWNISEYRLHFVPLSGAVTYWTSRFACSTPGVTMWICSPVAMALEYGMKKWVAPKLSDFVFKKILGEEPGRLDLDLSYLGDLKDENFQE